MLMCGLVIRSELQKGFLPVIFAYFHCKMCGPWLCCVNCMFIARALNDVSNLLLIDEELLNWFPSLWDDHVDNWKSPVPE